MQIFGASQSGCGREGQVRYFAPHELVFELSPTRCAAVTAALPSNAPSTTVTATIPTWSRSCAASAPRSDRFKFALHIVLCSPPFPFHRAPPLLFATFCVPFDFNEINSFAPPPLNSEAVASARATGGGPFESRPQTTVNRKPKVARRMGTSNPEPSRLNREFKAINHKQHN